MELIGIENYRYIDGFLKNVMLISNLQGKHVQEYYDAMEDEDRQALEKRIQYLCEIDGNSVAEVAESYIAWCTYFAEERKYYLTHNRQYRNHSFEEISEAYQDAKYMKNYMIGLSLSAYLWSIQRDNLKFFKKYCLQKRAKGGRYLEIGPGHGEYLSTAVENTDFDYYLGVDISESAANQTSSFLKYIYHNSPENLRKIEVKNQDFFEMDESDKFDAIVISQVIEHVENPRSFLEKARKISNPGALIYVSTAINSPFPDHIYHFHNSTEVWTMIDEAGFDIIDEFKSSSDGISLEKAIKKEYDIVIGFILRPKTEMNEYTFDDVHNGMSKHFYTLIDNEMMESFGKISGDKNPLHTDQEFALMNGYRDKVVYGMLTSSLLSKLVGMYLPGKNCLLLSIDNKFKQPIYIGEELEVVGTIEDTNDSMHIAEISAMVKKRNENIVALKSKIKVGFSNIIRGGH